MMVVQPMSDKGGGGAPVLSHMIEFDPLALSPSVKSWLEVVLQERFGQPLALQIFEDKAVLTCPSAPGAVTIDRFKRAFRQSSSDIPFTVWTAAAEGVSTPLNATLSAPGAEHLASPVIEKTKDGYRIHYDILGLTYWMLTRQEEIGRSDLDEHGRFPATASHAYRHGYLERPIVDEWLHILGQVIQRQWPGLKLKQHRFCMKVSHDVDGPSRYGFRSLKGLVRTMGGDVLKRRDLKSALLAPWIRLNTRENLHPADPANTFNWIMDVSERHGLTSAFYFICGRTDPSKDADYEPEHPAIRALMLRIHQRGHEIGLHPSYNTYRKPEAIVAEANRLRRICAEEGIQQAEWGGRMHYLRWEHPTTMRAWEQAGMSYDSTLSYADRPGFRCGTCFEYPAFDPVQGEMLNLRVRPLVAMECTVMAPCYMGLGAGEGALNKFRELKEVCKAVDGCFTLLWHNSQFNEKAERTLYQAILAA